MFCLKKMKIKAIVALPVLLGLGLRLLPAPQIFNGLGVKFTDPDAYFHAQLIRLIDANYPQIDCPNLLFCYNKVGYYPYQGYDFGVASIAQILPVKIDIIIAVFPVFLWLLTIALVYLIAWRLWGNTAAMIAISLVSIIPGEFLSRTLIGAADHHAAEVFLSTTVMAFVVLAIKTNKVHTKTLLFSMAAILSFVVYAKVWSGNILLLIPIAIFTGTFWMFERRISRSLGIYIFVNFAALFALLIVPQLLARAGAQASITFQTTAEALSIFSWPVNTGLIIRLICATGLFTVTIKILVGNFNRYVYFIELWLGTMILITLVQRRFDYYLAVPLCLIAGYLITVLADKLKSKKFIPSFLTIGACLVLLPSSVLIASDVPNIPSDDWQEALIWTQKNTPHDACIISWWDYGYWITYIGQRAPLCNPSQDLAQVKKAANILLGQSAIDIDGSCYIILDKRTVEDLFNCMNKWAGLEVAKSDSLAYQLYYGKVEGYELVYNSEVKIWQVK